MVNPAQNNVILYQGKDLRLEYTLPTTFSTNDGFRGRIRRSFDPSEAEEIAPGLTFVPLSINWTPPNLLISLGSAISATLFPNCKYTDLKTKTKTDLVGLPLSLPFVDAAYYQFLSFRQLSRQIPDYYALEVEWVQGTTVNPFIFGGVLVPGEVEHG